MLRQVIRDLVRSVKSMAGLCHGRPGTEDLSAEFGVSVRASRAWRHRSARVPHNVTARKLAVLFDRALSDGLMYAVPGPAYQRPRSSKENHSSDF